MKLRILLKTILLLILLPVALVVLLAVLLYVPPIQNWAIRQVASYLSEETGKQISVGHVALTFPLDLGVEDFLMTQRGQSATHPVDTIANARRLTISVQLLPLFKSEAKVDRLHLGSVKVNTYNFISNTQIVASIGNLDIRSRSINWKSEQALIDDATISNSQITILLSDTAKKDTTKSENHWKIDLSKLKLNNTSFALHMPGDSMSVEASMEKAGIDSVLLDLGISKYSIGLLDWQGGALKYNQNFTVKSKGFDTNHIALSNVRLLARGFSYLQPKLSVNIVSASFREKSGLIISSLSLPFSMDSTSISLPRFNMATSNTKLSGNFHMDMNAFDDHNPRQFSAYIEGVVAKQDINSFTGNSLRSTLRQIPSSTIGLRGKVSGNLKRLNLSNVNIKIPGHIALASSGWLANAAEDYRSGHLKFNLNARDAAFIAPMLLDKETRNSVKIPRGITASGTININNGSYGADISLRQGGGSVTAKAFYKTSNSQYRLSTRCHNFHIQNFLPTVGAKDFTGNIAAHGLGTDFLSTHTLANVKANIGNLDYDKWNLGGIKLDASLRNGRIRAMANSSNNLAKGFFQVEGLLSQKLIDVHFIGNISNLDFYRLGLTSSPLSIKGNADLILRTDLKENLMANGKIDDLSITERTDVFTPGDLTLDVLTNHNLTKASINCDDLSFTANADGGYKHLMSVAQKLQKSLERQIKDKWIDQQQLFALLPNGHISVSSGNNNVVAKMLQARGLAFKGLNADLTMATNAGINGCVCIDSLVKDTICIDSIDLRMNSADGGLRYSLALQNFKGNPQYQFRALLGGSFLGNGTNANLSIWDGQDRLGLDIGLAAQLANNGLKVNVSSQEAILGYKKFHVNDDNYLFLDNRNHLYADMKLLADDGAGVQLYTDTTNVDALQDATLSMHQFELEKVFSVLPFAPQMSGVVNGDFHVVQTAEQLTVSADIATKNLTYQNCLLGNLGAQLVYLPQADDTHMVSGILTKNDEEVGALNGVYSNKGEGSLDATFEMNRMPLDLVNGFVPNQIVGLKGTGEGSLTLKGPLSKLDINGEVFLDSSYLVSVPYGVQMRFANDPVRIVNSKLLLENFEMFANNDQPLDISGALDLTNLNNIRLDARMRALNFQIIDAKENPRSEVYGKAFVDFFGSINGPLSQLKMRGFVNVLGSTDMTYIMRDSELATDNELNELVTFVNLNDTLADEVTLPPLEGFNMDLQLNLDESARIFCALNSDKSNYADLMGKGSLRMQYNDQAGIRLSGRYTLANGEVKYSLPIIPLRTFTIADGSYIDFDGDPMNPRLNITATENVKATVTSSGSSEGRSVDFTAGVQLSNRLSKPGILFIINAPNDRTVEDELNTMSTEERAKVAVTMLASGIYLAGGSTSSFTMNSALSSFLQTEINNIAGRAMQSMGLNLQMGVENSVNSSGAMHTDYSFQFSKRFFNNRLSVLIGGKVSTGSQISDQNNNSFFDNVELQYRLGDTQSRYIRAFYNNSTYDWLEGIIGEYGVGFRWRRQLDKLSDLFKFKSPVPPASNKNDSVKNEK